MKKKLRTKRISQSDNQHQVQKCEALKRGRFNIIGFDSSPLAMQHND